MADSAFTFDTDIAFTPDNQMVLTGTADSSVAKIELTNTATNTDLGSAQISNGTWSFSQNIGTGTESFISAQVTDTSGKTTTVTDETAAFTNLKNTPYPNITENFTDSQNITFKSYSADGTLGVHGTYQTTENHLSATETGDQIHSQFVFSQATDAASVTQTITNFHVDGNSHDTLSLPHADFASMADLLRNTTMSGGNAVIQDPNNNATLTLMGVTKTEMKAHHGDFSFHG